MIQFHLYQRMSTVAVKILKRGWKGAPEMEDRKMMEEKYVEEIMQYKIHISHIAFDCTLSALNVSDTLMRGALNEMSRRHD